MLDSVLRFCLILRRLLNRCARREAEILVLRQQLIVLSRTRPRAPLGNIDRMMLVWLYRVYPSILNAVVIVKPETLLRWHRMGFRAYWRWKSSRRGGRPKIGTEIRDLIRRMSRENPLWGAPRVQWRTFDVGDRSRAIYSCEIHAASQATTIARLEDLLPQSRRWRRVARSVRSANHLL